MQMEDQTKTFRKCTECFVNAESDRMIWVFESQQHSSSRTGRGDIGKDSHHDSK